VNALVNIIGRSNATPQFKYPTRQAFAPICFPPTMYDEQGN